MDKPGSRRGACSPAELEQAFDRYVRTKDECSRTKDWRPFAKLFTEDCYYVEHAYGEFFGRDEVERYIVSVMAPFADMTFPIDWHVVDPAQGAIIFQVNNAFPPPLKQDGSPFMFPNITRLVLAAPPLSESNPGEGIFCEEQDWYNPVATFKRSAKATTKAWRRAGGKFETKERLKMRHDESKQRSTDSKL